MSACRGIYLMISGFFAWILVVQVSVGMAFIGATTNGTPTLYSIDYERWDEITVKSLVELPKPGGVYEFTAIATRPNTAVIYCFIGPQIITFDTKSAEAVAHEIPDEHINYFEGPALFAPDGTKLYVLAYGAGGVRGLILDSDTMNVIAQIPATKDLGFPGAVAFSRDGASLYVARQRTLTLNRIPSSDEASREIVTESGDLLAKLPSAVVGSPKCVMIKGKKIFIVDEKRLKDGGFKAIVTVVSGGAVNGVEINGKLLGGLDGKDLYCTLDSVSERLITYDLNGVPVTSVDVVFRDLWSMKETDNGKGHVGGLSRDHVGEIPQQTFTTGFMPSDGSVAVLVANEGIRAPCFASIINLRDGTASNVFQIGGLDGGSTNVVFSEPE